MLSRRDLIVNIFTATACLPTHAMARRLGRENISELQYPPPAPAHGMARGNPGNRGKPSPSDLRLARAIIDQTPHGPRAIDIAQSFVDRFSQANPAAISQRSPPAPPNPLIAVFIKPAGSLSVVDDPIPWCAAFVNFCIERNGGKGSSSASSQSFLTSPFTKVQEPQEGDLAVFTCYNPANGADMGLGHVAFFRRMGDGGQIVVVGGNQAGGQHASTISEKILQIGDQPVGRHLANGDYVKTRMRLNAYVRPLSLA
jgi:uncharacterized protein (TIGR02594 family)